MNFYTNDTVNFVKIIYLYYGLINRACYVAVYFHVFAYTETKKGYIFKENL